MSRLVFDQMSEYHGLFKLTHKIIITDQKATDKILRKLFKGNNILNYFFSHINVICTFNIMFLE